MDKKKMMIILGSVVGVITIIVVGLILYFLIFGGKQSYTQIEMRLAEAARNYYASNQDKLPKDEGVELKIDAATLSNAGYLPEMKKMTGDEISCSGSVIVKKNREDYFYAPFLDCGSNYKSITLSDKIKEDKTLSDDGSGLYELNNEFVFRGERPRNILEFAEKTWRIVKVNAKGETVLLLADPDQEEVSWDDRYNISTNANTGINDYKMSRIRNSLYNYYDENFTDLQKNVIASQNACIGKRNSDIYTIDGSNECSVLLEEEAISLLPAYDTINASLDPNCKAGEPSCQNYNYMSRVLTRGWWTLTANDRSTYRVYFVNLGMLKPADASDKYQLRPVIYLQKNLLYQGGSGTLEDPYIIQ